MSNNSRVDIEQPGVLCVIKSNSSVSDLRLYLESLKMGRVGPITIIYSKGRATSNSVSVLSRKMYDHILDLINGVVYPPGSIKPWSGATKISITHLEPYIIGDTHFPSREQTMDIFLRFDYSGSTSPVPSTGLRIKTLGEQMKSILDELISFKIIPHNGNIFEIDIPTCGNKVVEFGFIRFSSGTGPEIAIYIRSILNGHVLAVGTNIKISAYWCSKSPR